MSGYSSLKVAELKEKLKELSLPTSGTKADLIARLEEHDNAQDDIQETREVVVVDDEATPVPAAAPAPAPAPAPAADAAAATATDTSAITVEPQGGEKTEEVDYLKLVTEELDLRIKRAERFGLEGVEDLKKQRDRAIKFGVDAKQAKIILGGGKKPGNGEDHNRRGHGHGRHRGSKRSNNDGASATSAPIDDPEKLAARKKRFVQEA